MAITNGFDEDRILPVMIQRKGWRQPTQTGAPVIDATNLTCLSGKYFQQHHAACTIDAFKSTQEDSAISTANLNALLTAENESVCLTVLNTIFDKSTLVDKPSIAWDKYPDAEMVTVPNNGKFVYFRVTVADGNYAAQIHSISLMFDGAATFNIYCFHDMKQTALWSQSVTTVANSQVIVSLSEKILSYENASTKGNTFYIGYFQEDLGSVKALTPSSWETTCQYGYGVTFGSANAIDNTNFERRNYGLSTETFGLNPVISCYKDYTDDIIMRVSDFDQIIGDMMAANVVERTIFNQRSNKTQRIAQEQNMMLYTDLNQEQASEQSPYGSGLRRSIKNQIARLKGQWFPKEGIETLTPMDTSNVFVNRYRGNIYGK